MDDKWIGPYDIRVNSYVPYVPDKSGINRITKNGKSIIFEENTTDLSKEEYLDKYCYIITIHY